MSQQSLDEALLRLWEQRRGVILAEIVCAATLYQLDKLGPLEFEFQLRASLIKLEKA